MKIKKIKLLTLFISSFFFLFALTGTTQAVDYYVPTTTSTVDGDTFCGGVACTSADKIIIRGGARGGLLFQDFDGSGSYIPVVNESGASKVVINGKSGKGCLSISNCKYINLRGNNNPVYLHGIKVINDDSSKSPGTVWAYGESDHIKIGYIEATCEGNTSFTGNGIFVNDVTLTNAWTFDTFEIHHNYIHDTRYAGMYLGNNDPLVNNRPYVGTFSIHDNLLEDLGTYGITYKGINGSNNYIYNNTVRGSTGGQSTGLVPKDFGDFAFFGIGVGINYISNDYVEVYNNRVDKTVGTGLKIIEYGNQIHDNILCGCGSGDDPKYGHGILLYVNANGTNVYDNIIIQPKRYGIYAGNSISNCTDSRNLIGDAGLGERYDVSLGGSN